jgi:hypothetical protein
MAKSLEIVRHEKLRFFETCRQGVWLDLDPVIVRLQAYVEIMRPGGAASAIEETYECRGDLNALWPLIGLRMTKIVMDEDSFRLSFEDGTLVRCANRKDYDYVGVGEKDLKAETDYPSILKYLVDERSGD